MLDCDLSRKVVAAWVLLTLTIHAIGYAQHMAYEMPAVGDRNRDDYTRLITEPESCLQSLYWPTMTVAECL